jgi:hypothetical protein
MVCESALTEGYVEKVTHANRYPQRCMRTAEWAHTLTQWDNGPLGQFYTRKAPEIGARKAIIALARKLLIVAWRMLLTGEVYRAARATTVARKQRELQNNPRIPMPSTLPVPDPARHPAVESRRRGSEGAMIRPRTLVST